MSYRQRYRKLNLVGRQSPSVMGSRTDAVDLCISFEYVPVHGYTPFCCRLILPGPSSRCIINTIPSLQQFAETSYRKRHPSCVRHGICSPSNLPLRSRKPISLHARHPCPSSPSNRNSYSQSASGVQSPAKTAVQHTRAGNCGIPAPLRSRSSTGLRRMV